VLRDLALAGAGVAILPPWFLTEELAAKQLRIVLQGWTSETIHVHAIYRTRHRHEQRVRLLVEQLRAAFAA
jgi:DNA-binding transcriptional LysR family regulator